MICIKSIAALITHVLNCNRINKRLGGYVMKMKQKNLNESLSIVTLYMEGTNDGCTNDGCPAKNSNCTNYGNCKC